MTSLPVPVVLASGSSYRRELLGRLVADFSCSPANVDETARPGEGPLDLALRLARDKAEACPAATPDVIVIGSDQVLVLDGEVLRKPGTRDRAATQLGRCSGRSVVFHTAVCVLGPAPAEAAWHVDTTTVRFRELTVATISRYLDRENALDCAGGFKAEGLGIALMSAIETVDPTAIMGLPLIWLARCLAGRGLQLP